MTTQTRALPQPSPTRRHILPARAVARVAAVAAAVLLAGCATRPPASAPARGADAAVAPAAPSQPAPTARQSPPQPAPEGPLAYLRSPKGCAIVAGGDIGSRFENASLQAIWQRVNTSITDELHDLMRQGGYKVHRLIIDADNAERLQPLALEAQARHRCSRLLQIAHIVDEDEKGRFFRFDVALMRMQPKGGLTAKASGAETEVVAEFLRNYRYERTKQVLDNFYTNAFAQELLDELRQAGVLEPLR